MILPRLSTSQSPLDTTWISSQPDPGSTGAVRPKKITFTISFVVRIADEMKSEGSFYAETESGNLVDYKPARPVINRWVEIETVPGHSLIFYFLRIKDSMAA